MVLLLRAVESYFDIPYLASPLRFYGAEMARLQTGSVRELTKDWEHIWLVEMGTKLNISIVVYPWPLGRGSSTLIPGQFLVERNCFTLWTNRISEKKPALLEYIIDQLKKLPMLSRNSGEQAFMINIENKWKNRIYISMKIDEYLAWN